VNAGVAMLKEMIAWFTVRVVEKVYVVLPSDMLALQVAVTLSYLLSIVRGTLF
jgi:hypothetical protein